MSIKDKIELLTIEQRRQLAHAFDHNFSQYVEFGKNKFVGVNIDTKCTKNLTILNRIGAWSYGEIAK